MSVKISILVSLQPKEANNLKGCLKSFKKIFVSCFVNLQVNTAYIIVDIVGWSGAFVNDVVIVTMINQQDPTRLHHLSKVAQSQSGECTKQ